MSGSSNGLTPAAIDAARVNPPDGKTGVAELTAGFRAAPDLGAHGTRLYWRRLQRRPVTLVATTVVCIFFLLAVIGPWASPYSPAEQDYAALQEGPSFSHLFGTDRFGRDVFSRVLCGTRDVIVLGCLGVSLAVLLGTATGLLSGYTGGYVDETIMRFYDALLSIPTLLLAMVMIAMAGPSQRNLVLVIGILYMPGVARVVRSVVLDVRTKNFIEAAKVRGEKRRYILFREILPNALGPLMVEASMRFSYSIFLVASLGFLGLGVQPPSPDWGLQINEARNLISVAPWTVFFPVAAIALLIICVNLMTDGLKEITEPIRTGG